MQHWRQLTQKLGGLPLLWVTWSLAVLLSVWAVADLLVLRVSGGLANSTYDTMVRHRFHAPTHDPRIVIVDIDEASLQAMAREFGRWPWPRDTLATALDYIEKQQPAAIAWDVIFSDADRLSPGGDKAFDEAARRSRNSHFSVVRLPKEFDEQSQVTQAALPGLWLSPADGGASKTSSATIALIAPVLPAVAASRLGYNNGYPDADGVLRRYRLSEQLKDGGEIQSMALSVARSLASKSTSAPSEPSAMKASAVTKKEDLIVWRGRANSYPRISFVDVFKAAEGSQSKQVLNSFSGKIVLIGATASSLYDVHPTPLSPMHAGVDVLASAIDNAIHGHRLVQLPIVLQCFFALALVVTLAFWVLRKSISNLEPALLALPLALLVVSYLSLNVGGVFLDLHLPAGVALLFMGVLKVWNGWRRNYWCAMPGGERLALLPIVCTESMADAGLDRLIAALERDAPACRVVGGDAHAKWPAHLRWPELFNGVCIAGPSDQLQTIKAASPHWSWVSKIGAIESLPPDASRAYIARIAGSLLSSTPESGVNPST